MLREVPPRRVTRGRKAIRRERQVDARRLRGVGQFLLEVLGGSKVPCLAGFLGPKNLLTCQVKKVGTCGLVNDVMAPTVGLYGVNVVRMSEGMADEGPLSMVETHTTSEGDLSGLARPVGQLLVQRMLVFD